MKRHTYCAFTLVVLLAPSLCEAQIVVQGKITLQGNVTFGGVNISLASSQNPSTYASAVTFTATVTPSTAAGSVTFYDGATSLGTVALGGGTATLTVSTLSVGTHSITAFYVMSGTTSAAVHQTVNNVASSISLSSSANPSAPTQSVTFTAWVTPNLATGTVTFFNAGVSMGTAAISNGAAAFATSTLGAGSRSITASYGGDSNCAGSNTPSALVQVVNAGLTISSVALSSNPALGVPPATSWYSGQPITFTATVTSVPPGTAPANGETVTFYDGNVNIGQAPTAGGAATLNLNAGLAAVAQHSITARYPGDAALSASTSNPLVQNVGPYISGLSLSQGPPQMGFVVTVVGLGNAPLNCVGQQPPSNCVTLNGVNAAVVNWNPINNQNTVTAQVPPTGSGPVMVNVNGIQSNGFLFSVTGGFGCQ